jgi:hypothetical protein
MFESQLTDMLVNAGTFLVCVTGLVGFVAWLERGKIKQQKTFSKAC